VQKVLALSERARAVLRFVTRGAEFHPIIPLLLAANLCGLPITAAADEHEIPAVCSEREVQVITLLEDHGEGFYVRSFDNETLVWAGMQWLDARMQCYRGRTSEAVALYDEIVVKLSRASARNAR
jgi:hypothetical protein